MAHNRELTGEIARMIESKYKVASKALTKDIKTLITEDVDVISFKQSGVIKMAIGIITDKDSVPTPLIIFGAGDGAGNNRGYISKGTDGLSMYYIGSLAGGEVAGLKLKKDGVYSTHKIVVDSGLGSEFTVNATNWNNKLYEADMITIARNGAKDIQIPQTNLHSDVRTKIDNGASAYSYFDPVDSKLITAKIKDAAMDASKFNTKQIILVGDTWTDYSPTSYAVAWNSHDVYFNGVKKTISAGNTTNKYIYWTVGSTSYSTSNTMPSLADTSFVIAINNGGAHDIAWYSRLARKFISSVFIADAAILEAHIGNAEITSAKIASLDANKINAGTIIGFDINTAASGYERITLNSTVGFCKYDSNGFKRIQIDTSGGGGTIQFGRSAGGVQEIRGEILEGGSNFVIRPVTGLMVLGAPTKTTECYGIWDFIAGATVDFTGVTVTGLTGGGGGTGGDIDIGGTSKSHINGSGSTVTDTTTLFGVTSEFIPWSMDTKLMVKSKHLTQPYTVMEVLSDSTNVQAREATMALHVVDSVNGDYFSDISMLTYSDDPRMVFVAQSRSAPPPWMGHVISTDYFGSLATLEGLRYTMTGQAKGETRWRRTAADHVNMVRFGDYSSMTERLSWGDDSLATNRKMAIMFNAFCADYTNNYYQQYNAYADSYKFEMDGAAVDGAAGGGFKFFARPTIEWGKYQHNDTEWVLCLNIHKNGLSLGTGDIYLSHGAGTTDFYIGKVAKNTKFLGIVDFSGASSVTGLTAVFG